VRRWSKVKRGRAGGAHQWKKRDQQISTGENAAGVCTARRVDARRPAGFALPHQQCPLSRHRARAAGVALCTPRTRPREAGQTGTALQPLSLPPTRAVPLMAALLAVPCLMGAIRRYNLTPLQQRQQTYDDWWPGAWREASDSPSHGMEDLHWADLDTRTTRLSSTRPPPRRCYTADLSSGIRSALAHPLAYDAIDAAPPGAPPVEGMIARLANGKTLPVDGHRAYRSKTDGGALFMKS